MCLRSLFSQRDAGSPGAQLAAARALGKLAAHRSLRSAVSGATVIGAIVHLLRSGSFAARESAAVTLAALAADSRESQMCIAKAGAIPLLSSLIRDGACSQRPRNARHTCRASARRHDSATPFCCPTLAQCRLVRG